MLQFFTEMAASDSRGDVTAAFCSIPLRADGVCKDPKQTNKKKQGYQINQTLIYKDQNNSHRHKLCALAPHVES